jgi:hypothetical protein
LADRGTPGRVGLSATRCRLLHGFQGIGHVLFGSRVDVSICSGKHRHHL